MGRSWDLCCICGFWKWVHRILPHAYQAFDVNRDLEAMAPAEEENGD